jgi:hypothetical protein
MNDEDLEQVVHRMLVNDAADGYTIAVSFLETGAVFVADFAGEYAGGGKTEQAAIDSLLERLKPVFGHDRVREVFPVRRVSEREVELQAENVGITPALLNAIVSDITPVE